MFFCCFSCLLLNFNGNRKEEWERDREREKGCVRTLTAIKAIRQCWHKYLTLRGNLQHVMSRPWLGWTVTPSHITWFHVGEWGGHVSVIHRLHIRGRTMLPLTLISIKPFLWNSVPHRPQLPTCLFSICRWCRILAERAVCETRASVLEMCECVCGCACTSLYLTLDLFRAWWCRFWRRAVYHSAYIIWLFPIDWFKNVFPMLCHCLQIVKGEPPVNNSSLNWKEIYTWNLTCKNHSTLKKQLQSIER